MRKANRPMSESPAIPFDCSEYFLEMSRHHVCGFIAANRTDKPTPEKDTSRKALHSTGYNASENTKLNEILIYLMGRGYAVMKVAASYLKTRDIDAACDSATGELSYFVCNDKVRGDDGGQLCKDLVALGRRFDLDAILVIPCGARDRVVAPIENAFLIGTSDREGVCPTSGVAEAVKETKAGAATTQLFKCIQESQVDCELVEPLQTINGIRGQQILVRKLAKDMGLDTG